MLRLRQFKLSDSKYMVNWVKDIRIFEQWCAGMFEYPLTKDELRRYYYQVSEKDDEFIFIAVDDIGKPVGHFLMKCVDYKTESAFIGFVLIDKDERGKGYGREMITLAVKYAFDILKLKRITLRVFDCNERAHECYKNVGFKDEELLNESYNFEGESWRRHVMSIENK